jgi:putative intracellular protease/amidase
MSTVLFVVTGATTWTLSDGTQHPTGYWAEELLTPYSMLTAAGHDVVVATPGGVVPTVDAASLAPAYSGGEDLAAVIAGIDALRHPLTLDGIDLVDYDAVFYPGGHGPMQDLASDPVSGRLLVAALDAHKPLAVVCHGAAALLAATRDDGRSAIVGRHVTGFSDLEETQGGLASAAPFLVESSLRSLGADVRVGEPWVAYVVVDGALISGQNPQSSASVAAALLAQL